MNAPAMQIVVGAIIAFLLAIIWYMRNNICKHLIEHTNGFWVSEALEGECVLYLNNGELWVIESDSLLDSVSSKRGTYKLLPKSSTRMDIQTYHFRVDGLSGRSKLVQKLTQKNLRLDMYPIEGTCIIYTSEGDILTLIKDHKSGLSLLV